MNIQQMIQQALMASIPTEKIAEACDDDPKMKGKDDKKDKEKKDDKDEVKKACDLAHQLRDLNLKVAAELSGSPASSDLNSVPATTYPEHFGQGKQQIKSPTSLPAGRDLPTAAVDEATTTNAAKIAGAAIKAAARKLANDTAASLNTKDVSQPAGGSGVPSSGPAVIGSNEGLRNMTPSQATNASNKRQDLGQFFHEGALNSSTDTTLKEVFEHTEGNKMASALSLFERLQREVNQ